MKKAHSLLLKYGITAAVGGCMAWTVLDLHGFAAAQSLVDKYRILADAFTIPGVVILLSGVLVLISNEGIFEGLSYVMSYAVKMLIPGAAQKMETFRDYLLRRRENRVKGYGFLYVTAVVFLAAAGVFMALFYSVYRK